MKLYIIIWFTFGFLPLCCYNKKKQSSLFEKRTVKKSKAVGERRKKNNKIKGYKHT